MSFRMKIGVEAASPSCFKSAALCPRTARIKDVTPFPAKVPIQAQSQHLVHQEVPIISCLHRDADFFPTVHSARHTSPAVVLLTYFWQVTRSNLDPAEVLRAVIEPG